MPNIIETITIPAPLDEVWPLLSDPAIVASCIPGATLQEDQEDDVWKGSIRVKFGPTVAVFRGEATLDYDHTAHRCTIEGRGIDQRGASRALANGTVTAAGDGETQLTVAGEYSVSGPLETFANAGGVHVARALLAEFASNMSERVGAAQTTGTVGAVADQAAGSDDAAGGEMPSGAASSPAAGRTTAAAPKPAAELNAFGILWAAFVSWFKSLFSKRTS